MFDIIVFGVSILLAVLHVFGLCVIMLSAFHIKCRTLEIIFWVDGFFIVMLLFYNCTFSESFPFLILITILLFVLCLEYAFQHTASPDKVYTLDILSTGKEDFFDENHNLIFIQYVNGIIKEEDNEIFVRLYAPVTQDFTNGKIKVKSVGNLKNGYLVVMETDDNGTLISKRVV